MTGCENDTLTKIFINFIIWYFQLSVNVPKCVMYIYIRSIYLKKCRYQGKTTRTWLIIDCKILPKKLLVFLCQWYFITVIVNISNKWYRQIWQTLKKCFNAFDETYVKYPIENYENLWECFDICEDWCMVMK